MNVRERSAAAALARAVGAAHTCERALSGTWQRCSKRPQLPRSGAWCASRMPLRGRYIYRWESSVPRSLQARLMVDPQPFSWAQPVMEQAHHACMLHPRSDPTHAHISNTPAKCAVPQNGCGGGCQAGTLQSVFARPVMRALLGSSRAPRMAWHGVALTARCGSAPPRPPAPSRRAAGRPCCGSAQSRAWSGCGRPTGAP